MNHSPRKTFRAAYRRVMWRVAALLLLSGCSRHDAAIATPPTGPVTGQVGGKSFTTQVTLAHWSTDGKSLIVGMYGEPLSCADIPPIPSPPGHLEVDLLVPKGIALSGAAQAYVLGDESGIKLAAARVDFDGSGHPINWSDSFTDGNGAISDNTSNKISGWVMASDSTNNTAVSGAFAASVCGTQSAH